MFEFGDFKAVLLSCIVSLGIPSLSLTNSSIPVVHKLGLEDIICLSLVCVMSVDRHAR